MLKIFRFRQKFKIDLINTIQTYASSEKKTATDYYNVLGLRPGCTEEQLKLSYLQLVKRFHPDLNSSPNASQQFLQIQQAYDYLLDPSNRIKNAQQQFSSKKDPMDYDWEEKQKKIKEFRDRFYKNYRKKQNVAQQMQFSYRLFKKHDEKINEKKKQYTKYHGHEKQYYAKNDEEYQPVWKTVIIATGMIGIGLGAVWIVNLK